MNTQRMRKIKNLYFGYEEIARVLGITYGSARVTASRYVKQGLLVRVKRNLYVLRERWDNMDEESFFVIANIAQVPSYISLMTALDYYGVTTQMQRNFTESVAIKRTREIQADDRIFAYSKVRRELYFGFVKERGFFIASPEKALADALYLKSVAAYNFDTTSISTGRLNRKSLQRVCGFFPKNTRELAGKYGYI